MTFPGRMAWGISNMAREHPSIAVPIQKPTRSVVESHRRSHGKRSTILPLRGRWVWQAEGMELTESSGGIDQRAATTIHSSLRQLPYSGSQEGESCVPNYGWTFPSTCYWPPGMRRKREVDQNSFFFPLQLFHQDCTKSRMFQRKGTELVM